MIIPDGGRFEEITARDYFAAVALQGMISAWPTVATMPLKYEVASSAAYKYADAMIAERKK